MQATFLPLGLPALNICFALSQFLVKPVDGVALEPPDLDRLGIALVIHARAFAERTDGTDARGNSFRECWHRGCLSRLPRILPEAIFLNKCRNVDVRRAGACAGRVEAE